MMTAKDPRFLLAAILLVGYYLLLVIVAMATHPLNNPDIFKDGMIVLGPPVGAVFASLFRSDAVDEKRAQNTSDAFAAITAAATGTPTGKVTEVKPGEATTVVGTAGTDG